VTKAAVKAGEKSKETADDPDNAGRMARDDTSNTPSTPSDSSTGDNASGQRQPTLKPGTAQF
jgi:hypothetical protein